MLNWNKEGREIMAKAELPVPRHLYEGCGRAWVAINEAGEIVGVRYMNDHPYYAVSDFMRETGRKRRTALAKRLHTYEERRRFGAYRAQCRAELAKLGRVVSGDMSGTYFYPAEAITAAVAATLR
jgi:hypothetical protein